MVKVFFDNARRCRRKSKSLIKTAQAALSETRDADIKRCRKRRPTGFGSAYPRRRLRRAVQAGAIRQDQSPGTATMTDFAVARFNMVESQIRPNKVTDQRVVDAMMRTPREVFVPAAARGVAYVDDAVAIAKGRYLMEPMVFARMLQAAEVQPGDVVLDVGCGTGYSSAVIAQIAATVVGVESDPELAAKAGNALAQVGADNAVVIAGPLTAGYAAQAPYDVIFINGAASEIPAELTAQLADGGRLVAVLRGEDGVGVVRVFRRAGEAVSSRPLFETLPALLPGFEPKPTFRF